MQSDIQVTTLEVKFDKQNQKSFFEIYSDIFILTKLQRMFC